MMIHITTFLIAFSLSQDIKESLDINELKDLSYGIPIGTLSGAIISPLDNIIREWVQGKDSEKMGKILSIPGEGIFVVPLCISGYIGGIVLKNQRIRTTFLRASISLGLTTISVQILKFIGRHRPYDSPENQWKFSPPGIENRTRSFPSGHSQASASVYFTLSRICEDMICKAFFISVPFVVAFGRVASNNHWASDTVGGIIIGSSFELF